MTKLLWTSQVLFILLISALLLPATVLAQTQTFSGITYNNKIMGRVAQVTITNLQHRAVAFSNDVGIFSINAMPGDTLLFSKIGFTGQKVAVGTQKDIIVYLVPALLLDDVVVTAKTRRQEQKEIMNAYRSQGTFYNGKPPALSFLSSPLTGIYELFGKTPGRARHFANYIKQENQQIEINKRYTPELVKRITKLPDEEVPQFMLAYSPPYPEMLKWNDYELIQFINRSMAGYKSAKDLPPLPKLTSP